MYTDNRSIYIPLINILRPCAQARTVIHCESAENNRAGARSRGCLEKDNQLQINRVHRETCASEIYWLPFVDLCQLPATLLNGDRRAVVEAPQPSITLPPSHLASTSSALLSRILYALSSVHSVGRHGAIVVDALGNLILLISRKDRRLSNVGGGAACNRFIC